MGIQSVTLGRGASIALEAELQLHFLFRVVGGLLVFFMAVFMQALGQLPSCGFYTFVLKQITSQVQNPLEVEMHMVCVQDSKGFGRHLTTYSVLYINGSLCAKYRLPQCPLSLIYHNSGPECYDLNLVQVCEAPQVGFLRWPLLIQGLK